MKKSQKFMNVRVHYGSLPLPFPIAFQWEANEKPTANVVTLDTWTKQKQNPFDWFFTSAIHTGLPTSIPRAKTDEVSHQLWCHGKCTSVHVLNGAPLKIRKDESMAWHGTYLETMAGPGFPEFMMTVPLRRICRMATVPAFLGAMWTEKNA